MSTSWLERDAPPDTVEGFRLSPPQLRSWLLGREAGRDFRSRCALRIEGGLDASALERALAATIAGHEILRAGFHVLPGMTLPLQVIYDHPCPIALPAIDARGLEPAARQTATADALRALGDLPCDSVRGAVLGAALLRTSAVEHILLLDLPALCADAATFRLLGAELAYACATEKGASPGPGEPPLQYMDVAEWLHEILESPDTAEGLERWREHWQTRRIEEQLRLRLPFERPVRRERAFAPRSVDLLGDRGLAKEVAALCAARGVLVPSFFLACWQIVLGRSLGRSDVLVGVLHDGRGHDELRRVLGPLARHLPVCCHLDGEMRLWDLVESVERETDQVRSRQELFDWQRLAGARPGDEVPFFPACFAEEEPWEHHAANLLWSLAESFDLPDRFKLELRLRWTGGLPAGRLRYDPQRFRRGEMEILGARFETLLQSLVARPEAPLGDLELVSGGERRLLAGFAATPDREHARGCLHDLLRQQARRTPDRVALVHTDGCLSYAALDELAGRLAGHLRAAGIRAETPVALCIDRSLEAIVAVLGVLMAGGAWVPLDPSHPAERLAFILNDAGVPLLLTQRHLEPGLRATGRPVACIEDLLGRPVPGSARPEQAAGRVDARNLAYAIYTSGSTGSPKGVFVEHRSPVALLSALEGAVLGGAAGEPPLRATLNAPLVFDASVQQLVLLLAGHTLHVIPDQVRVDGAALLELLQRHSIDLLDCTPSQLRILLSAGLLDGVQSLPRKIIVAGEAIDGAMWSALRASPHIEIYNVYGPTECTVDATACRIASRGEEPVIGRPLPGYEAHVLDRELRSVPLEAPGELCLGGAGLARGYLGRPDLTADRFRPHPFSPRPGARLYRSGDLARVLASGDLEFLGRADDQVKIRGYRIEPGEVAAVLVAHPAVAQAVVVAHQHGAEPARLVAYLVPGGGRLDPDDLQSHLKSRLPAYMVPSLFIELERLPLLPSGKVDRRSLPKPRAGMLRERRSDPPGTELERTVAAIWQEALACETIGREDDFFDLGGHSLLMIGVQSALRQAGFEVSLTRLFQHSTLRSLAEHLEREEPAPRRPSCLVEIQAGDGSRPPLFLIHPVGGYVHFYRDLAWQLGADQPVHGVRALGLEEGEEPPGSVEEAAAVYVEEILRFQPAGPYRLGGSSLGGLIAYEMAQQLRAQGREVGLLVLLDTPDPGQVTVRPEDESEIIAGLLGQRLPLSAEDLRRMDPEERLHHIIELARETGGLQDGYELGQARRHMRVVTTFSRAMFAYRPEPFPGRLLFFRAAERGAKAPLHPELAWIDLAREGTEVHVTPGGHMSMHFPPHVEELGRHLRAALRPVSPKPSGADS